jgi:hypothetical protein
MINNDVKIDFIGQHQGENLAQISFIQDQIKNTTDQVLIDEYNNKINDFLAKNTALESLKQTLI